MTDDELALAALDDEARECAPRLFALYGVYRTRLEDDDDGVFLGFGMEFDEPPKAVMWEDGSMTRSDSAASILRRRARRADARLVWLHKPDRPTREDYDLAGG